jgi:prophage regulatory protein
MFIQEHEVSATNPFPSLPPDDYALVSIKQLPPLCGVGPAAIYKMTREGRFPAPRRVSDRCSRYRAGDIRRWLLDPRSWHAGLALDAHAANATTDLEAA